MDEVGQKLREARLAKGYTLDDLQKITKIQKRYLIAIEEGNFDALPGNFYVRAFIKQYADSVGLDGDKLLKQYEDALPSLQPQETVTSTIEEQPTSREQKNYKHNWWTRNRRYMPQIIIIALVVIVIGGIWIIAAKRNHANQQQMIAQPSSVKITSSSSSKKTSSSSSSQSSSSSSSQSKQINIQQASVNGSLQTFNITDAPQNNNQITISTNNQASSWTSVIIGGRTVYQGVVTTATPHTINVPNGTKQVIIRSGNAPKTTIKVNNKDVNINDGVKTTVRTLTFNYK